MPASFRRFFVSLLFVALAAAVGCRNGATRDDPFLQRRLIPPPPPANYSPATGGTYYPPGAPVLQPVPGPATGQWQGASGASASGTILPASAGGATSGGWVPASGSASVPLDRSAADGTTDSGEPRRLVVDEGAARNLPSTDATTDRTAASLAQNAATATSNSEKSSPSLQSDATPSSMTVTSLDWAAPRRP